MCCKIIYSIRSFNKLYVFIKLIYDHYICFRTLIVLIAYFVFYFISYINSTKDTISFIRSLLFLLWCIRYRIFYNFKALCCIVSNLNCCCASAVYNLSRSLFAAKCSLKNLYLKCYISFCKSWNTCQIPCNCMCYRIVCSTI